MSKRSAQKPGGSHRFRGKPIGTVSARHLDARERQRHESRDFEHRQAVEAIGDPFAPEQDEIEAEMEAMIRRMR